MSNVNDFLPFCPTDTGTNLESQSAYIVDTSRTDGNQPGIASSKLNNKALRQATYVGSQIAQLISNLTTTDVLDNATPAQLLAQIMATFQPFPVNLTSLLSGSGSFSLTYMFMLASANATVGATYTNNGVTYTVKSTIAAGAILKASGIGAPTASGTLTKASGTGDASILFFAVRAPLWLEVEMAGGGAGGTGTGSGSGTGSNGGDTVFGVMTAGGGLLTINQQGGLGGSVTPGSGPVGQFIHGTQGSSDGGNIANDAGGSGGQTPHFCGAGAGGLASDGFAATANSGAGGGGASAGSAIAPAGGGGSGAYIKAILEGAALAAFIASPTWSVGTAGLAGGGGSGGFAAGAGAAGAIYVTEHYQ